MNMMMRDTCLALNDKDATFCYGMSKMTVANESEEATLKYKRLQFVEFLEMLGRIADLKFKGTDMERMKLTIKMEYVLEDVLALVGATRKDVNIVVNEESESDDEY